MISKTHLTQKGPRFGSPFVKVINAKKAVLFLANNLQRLAVLGSTGNGAEEVLAVVQVAQIQLQQILRNKN